MMGSDMKYGGWLALRMPEIQDDSAAEKANKTLEGIQGVKTVAVYTKQGSIGVQFAAQGRNTTNELVDALNEAGLEGSNY